MHPSLLRLNPKNSPDQSWDYTAIDAIIPSEVHEVTDHFNRTDFDTLLQPLRDQVTTDGQTGIDYLLLKDAASSHDTVVLHFNPFANGMRDNMLMRATYLHQVFEKYGLANIPFLSFAAPSGSPNIKLKRHHYRSSNKGEFHAIAAQYLQIVQAWGYKNLYIIGFSQGATLAAAVAAIAPDHGFTVTHLAVGEPANVIKRSRRKLGKDFDASAQYLNDTLDATGIHHLKNFYVAGSQTKYLLRLAKMARLNMSLTGGLGKATFKADLQKVLQHDTIITVGWGGLNTISPPATMRALIDESRADDHAIHTVEIQSAHHTWADHLNLLATFYSYALTRNAS